MANRATLDHILTVGADQFYIGVARDLSDRRAVEEKRLEAERLETMLEIAGRWLETHFSATSNPGRFNDDRHVLRDATYYYWTWAAAHAFLALKVREIETAQGRIDWTEAMARELLRRQRPDGTWHNRYTDAMEDDPLVATPWAAAALAICRAMMTGRPETLPARCRSPRASK